MIQLGTSYGVRVCMCVEFLVKSKLNFCPVCFHALVYCELIKLQYFLTGTKTKFTKHIAKKR